jgi:hypothetical protein
MSLKPLKHAPVNSAVPHTLEGVDRGPRGSRGSTQGPDQGLIMLARPALEGRSGLHIEGTCVEAERCWQINIGASYDAHAEHISLPDSKFHTSSLVARQHQKHPILASTLCFTFSPPCCAALVRSI